MQLIVFALFIVTVQAAFAGHSTPHYKRSLMPRQPSCSNGQSTCSFGGCCPANTTCTIVNNVEGCCPFGVDCGKASSSATESPTTSPGGVVEVTTSATSSSPETACAAGFVSCGNGGCCAVTSSNSQPQPTPAATTGTRLHPSD
jgi:hypothetical protein